MQASTPLITNEQALDEDVPPSRRLLVERDVFDDLATPLQPIERGESIESMRVFGPPGTGKSHGIRVVLNDLATELGGLDWTYISCWDTDTRTRILAQATAAVTDQPVDALANRSGPDLRRELRTSVSRPYMVVIDEADILDTESMRALRDILSAPDTAVTVIANDEEDFFQGVSPSLESRLRGSYQYEFPAYSVPDLVDILRVRAEAGLRDDAWTPAHLEAIAEAARGNAREAIVALRTAAKAAANDGRSTLSIDDIDEAVPDAREYIRRKDYRRLDDHQQELVDIIADAGEVACTELAEQYHDRVDEPVSERQRRRTLTKLEHYGFIEKEGATKDAAYRYLDVV